MCVCVCVCKLRESEREGEKQEDLIKQKYISKQLASSDSSKLWKQRWLGPRQNRAQIHPAAKRHQGRVWCRP